MNNVVITGMDTITPSGFLWNTFHEYQNNGHTPVHRGGMRIDSKYDRLMKFPRNIDKFMTKTAIWPSILGNLLLSGKKNRLDRSKVGLVLGSTINSPLDTENMKTSDIFRSLNCSPASLVALELKLSNTVLSVSSACGSSLQAMALGTLLIRTGMLDAVLVGGCDVITDNLVEVFRKLKILSNSDVCHPCRDDRNGTVLSEGASMFLLENKKTAIDREARILGEVTGIGTTMSNSLSVSSVESIEACMLEAHNDALNTEHRNWIDYKILNLHATGTVNGDKAESEAVNHVRDILGFQYIVAWKSLLQHTLAASGLLELAMSIHNRHSLGGDLVIDEDAHACDNENVVHIMANSFGLGGINTTVVVRL